ncbi:hypothetical protein BE04_31845 [Sorangium cellulosum]|uniref:Uncharacterized protein n=2 Tax=Sorangium cellulosum TaxID=56 RepID=A0A150TIJ2_SORCE|nr:hypothetical protein [Sorangium cellulosum]AGP38702.1 hypothetical protein SCE1572_31995 [Sorangium cellulosum So0157-2]KYF48751.1 hypothetical protein BE04_31845 [Sorangium cellulosum]KYG04514.1 hypothetical protein BE21_03925 [Sorangium cellulosum]
MSVVLMTTSRQGDTRWNRLVPVAAQSTFKELWIPAAEALGLQWVPLFEAGFPLERSDLPDVIRELEALRAWCVSSESHRRGILERLDRLIDELNEISKSDHDVEIFIG